MGINPVSAVRNNFGTLSDQSLSTDEQEIQRQVDGMKTSDAFVLRMFKAMGLSEKTMVAIEADLRQQQANAMKI